jgi:hypothetical protein
MKSKSIILPLIGAALLSITPAVGRAQATKQAESKQEATPSRVVLHSMRAKRLHAKHAKGAAMAKVAKKQVKATTAKSTKEQATSGKRMVKKVSPKTAKRRATLSKKTVKEVSSKTAKGKSTSSKLMRRTKQTPKKHHMVKKSSTKS